jgi:arsenate reductase-like glutaredoxin family protein
LQELGLELNSKKTYIRRLQQSGDAIHLLGLNIVKTDTDTNRITVSDSYIRKTSIDFCNLLYNKNKMDKEELDQAFLAVNGKIQFIINASEKSAKKLQKMLSVKLSREIRLDHQTLSRMFATHNEK